MGHPDGAHTHGSGGGGLGELLVILLAVALLGPAVAAAGGRAGPRFADHGRGSRGRRCRLASGPARLAATAHPGRRGPRHAPENVGGAGRSTAPAGAASGRTTRREPA
jgi:hypothetical protein